MRLAAILAGAVLLAAAGEASAQVCTTSTTVVSNGPQVVSSTTTTRCEAAPAPPAPEAGPAPCTQTTTVVRRLDVVVSSSTQIKCEEPGSSGDGGGGVAVPKAVFAAPGGAANLLGKVLGGGPGDELTAASARGDWHVLDARARQVCQLFLMISGAAQGLGLRKRDCTGALATAVSWAFDGGAVVFRTRTGAEVIRFTGTRERMGGVTSDGMTIVLGR